LGLSAGDQAANFPSDIIMILLPVRWLGLRLRLWRHQVPAKVMTHFRVVGSPKMGHDFSLSATRCRGEQIGDLAPFSEKGFESACSCAANERKRREGAIT